MVHERGENMQSAELLALSYLPPSLAEPVRDAMALHGETFRELRLYREGQILLVYGNRNLRLPCLCSAEEMQWVLGALCGNSLYAHEETLREGYIYTAEGLRVGVCGRAVCDGGRVVRITEISSLCIRIPHRVRGAADALLPLILREDRLNSVLIWSPPGVGKTTMLHELAVQLGRQDSAYRMAIVDTRMELGADVQGANILCGYPRAGGIENAVRFLNPQIVICDEIYSREDCDAVLYGASCGVAVVASAHAACYKELEARPAMRPLLQNGIFSHFVGLHWQGDTMTLEIREAT